MKTRQDNNMINHIGAIYHENEIELSWLIGSGAVYEKNQKGQQHDRLHRACLCQKWYSFEQSRPIKLGAFFEENKIGQWHDQSYKCNIWWKRETKLSWSIESGVVCDKKKTRQWHDLLYRYGLWWKCYWTIGIYRIGCDLWWKPDKTRMWLIIQVCSMPKKRY